MKTGVADEELESKMFSMSISRNSKFMVAGIFPNTAEAEWAPSSAVSPATSLTAAHEPSSVRGCCLLSTTTPAVNGGEKVLFME